MIEHHQQAPIQFPRSQPHCFPPHNSTKSWKHRSVRDRLFWNNGSKLTGVTAIHLRSSTAKGKVGCSGCYSSKFHVNRWPTLCQLRAAVEAHHHGLITAVNTWGWRADGLSLRGCSRASCNSIHSMNFCWNAPSWQKGKVNTKEGPGKAACHVQ